MNRSQFVRTQSAQAFAVAWALMPCFAWAMDVPKWSTYDINLTSNTSYANGYASGPTQLTATFTGPGGVTQNVTGFWDGTNNFKFRFTPTVEGAWSYTTSSTDTSLNGQTGSLNAVAPAAGNHGFLRIDPAHTNSFAWDDGTRYFMWGQIYDNIVQTALATSNANWQAGIDNSLAHGFSKIRLNVYPDSASPSWTGKDSAWSTLMHGYAYSAPYALLNNNSQTPDRDQLNLAYWQKLDDVVKYIDSKGMVAELILVNPYNANNVFGSDTQNQRLLDYAMARYAGYHNVTWCVSWEYGVSANAGGTYPQDAADFNGFGQRVRSKDPWLTQGTSLRPLSIHSNTNIDFPFATFPNWPTSAVIQYGPRNQGGFANGDQWGNAGIVQNLGHNMPVVNDEYGYIDDESGVTMTQLQSRQAIWGIATAGGYGSSGDWRTLGTGSAQWKPNLTGEWYDAPEYDDIKHVVDFFTTKGIEYWKMASHNELTSDTRTYVLAEPGKQYVAYAAVGGDFSIDLAAGSYYAYRYDPQTGATTDLGTITGGGTQSFSMPDTNDWVLHLSTFQETPEPGALTLLGVAAAGLAVYWRRRRRRS